MVIWMIGMSASGKTTIGKKLFEKLEKSDEKWIFLDGDTFRNILGEDLGHTIKDREKNAYRISRFCEYLVSQNINVLACVLSIFHENQRYNKENIPNYKEVYIDVDFDQLLKRDNKELYKKALNGEIKDVVGVDIEFKPPYSPDIVIDNNQNLDNFEDVCQEILQELNIKLDESYSYTRNNLLNKPHKYQYSQFEGSNFFKKFSKDREETLSFLKARESRFKNLSIVKNESEGECDENSFNLEIFLKDELKKNESIDFAIQEKLALLIKRFEVSKKLYRTYSIDEVRKSSLEYQDLINYPLFSLFLQKCYHDTNAEKKLIYLNAILKVNDIISSIKEEVIIPSEISYCIEAIEGEQNITKEYVC